MIIHPVESVGDWLVVHKMKWKLIFFLEDKNITEGTWRWRIFDDNLKGSNDNVMTKMKDDSDEDDNDDMVTKMRRRW